MKRGYDWGAPVELFKTSLWEWLLESSNSKIIHISEMIYDKLIKNRKIQSYKKWTIRIKILKQI